MTFEIVNTSSRIAVLVPCYNEALTIAQVIRDFRAELPEAVIYVYDNNSSDDTARIAELESTIVRFEPRQGKGNVVRSMFKDIDADVYVMVDGDATYPAKQARQLIEPILEGSADMVVGDRLSNNSYFKKNDRRFHSFGNRLVRSLINRIFRTKLKDIMSGYRAFSREFVKNFPVMSEGFEIETEMTLHALAKRFRITEIPIDYKNRPEGSHSKLNTISDGRKVINTIFSIYKNYRPLRFFTVISLVLLILGLWAGSGPIIDYIDERYVHRVPLAILATGLVLCSFISMAIGLILNTINHYHQQEYELQLIRYREAQEKKVEI